MYLAQNRLDKVTEYLNKLDRVSSASPGDRAWANRTRIALLLSTGRRADRDRALGLVEQNLRNNPDSIEDQGLKATILACRPDRRGEAIKILEQLAGANRLDANERFLLAQLYLDQRDEEKYRSEMLKLLNLKARQPQHLAHFINFWIGRKQLDQAAQWLASLKEVDPQGPARPGAGGQNSRSAEAQARVAGDARGPRPGSPRSDRPRGGPLESLRVREGGRGGVQGLHRPRTQAARTGPRLGAVPGPPGSGLRGDGDTEESLERSAVPNRSPPLLSRCSMHRRWTRPRDGRWKPGWPRRSGGGPRQSPSLPNSG